jgi:hypothetical protein
VDNADAQVDKKVDSAGGLALKQCGILGLTLDRRDYWMGKPWTGMYRLAAC